MEIIDFIIFPFFVMISIAIVYLIGQRQSKKARRYFMPAYLLKVIGGFSLGLIYMYYYGHGDTTAYFRVAGVINEGISDSLGTWFRLIFGDINSPDLLTYKARMSRYTSGAELFVVRIIAIFSLLSFGSYYATMIWFASFSFLGAWLMYRSLIDWYPYLAKELAWAIFFIPSVVFWGSGLMKDTLIMGCMGLIVYGAHHFLNKNKVIGIFILILSIWILVNVRNFMLPVILLPALAILLFKYTIGIKNIMLRVLSILLGFGAIFVIVIASIEILSNQLTEFAQSAKVSSHYLYRVSLEKNGSAYNIGTVDGTIQNLFELAPTAIWVSLFRPYPWESNNVVMLLTALENFILLVGVIILLLKTKIIGTLKCIAKDSYLQYALVFCLFFAFVTGITTFNFGSLARYRIPILPFFVSSLFIIRHHYIFTKTRSQGRK